MSIQNRALLADLTLGKFNNKIEDKQARLKLVEFYECDEKAISSKKTILSKCLKPVHAILSQCYLYHIKTTLPWEDRSWRLIPTIKMFDYTDAIRSFKDQLAMALIDLEKIYQSEITNDEAYLKGLQKISDYPPFEVLSSQFHIELNFAPISSSADFRIECEEDQLKKLKESFEEREKGLLDNVTNDLLTRLKAPLEHLVKTLVDPSIKVYHKSLLTNIESNLELVKSYNLQDNVNITSLIKQINEEVLIYDIKTLKVDAPAKTQIINNSVDIIKKINDY